MKEWDVITRIGDTPIDNQGMVKLDKDLRVSFAFLIQRLAKDGVLPLTVVRAGKTLQLQLPVSAEHPTLVARSARQLSVRTSSTGRWCFPSRPGR